MRGVKGSGTHGTNACYIGGCRRPECTKAHGRHRKMLKLDEIRGVAHTVPGVGTARRLRALAAIGWPEQEIAARLGCDRTWVSQARRESRPRVFASTARSVAGIYDELHMTPGPSTRTRTRALKAGWPPPLAYEDIDDPTCTPVVVKRHGVALWDLSHDTTDDAVDHVAIDRALTGGHVELTRPERLVVVARLAARGMSDADMAQRLDVTARTIFRDRQDAGIESQWSAA